MDELGVAPELAAFSDRLRFQKGIYLLQRLGLRTEFSYNWYLRGPYSPSLTEAAFEEVVKPIAQGDRTHQGYSLSAKTKRRVSLLKAMMGKCTTLEMSEEKWLELLASMAFYKHEMYFPPKSRRDDPDWLYDQFPPAKKRTFTREMAQEAATLLRQNDLW